MVGLKGCPSGGTCPRVAGAEEEKGENLI